MKLTHAKAPLFGKKVTLPAGTPLQLKTTQDIHFNQARAGESFNLKLTQPVLAPDVPDILIRSGAEVTAIAVVDEHEPTFFGAIFDFLTKNKLDSKLSLSGGSRATLQFKHGRTKAVDGTTVPLTSKEEKSPIITQPLFFTAPPWVGDETLLRDTPISAQTTRDVIIDVPEPEAKQIIDKLMGEGKIPVKREK
jgi:hypothetical protein